MASAASSERQPPVSLDATTLPGPRCQPFEHQMVDERGQRHSGNHEPAHQAVGAGREAGNRPAIDDDRASAKTSAMTTPSPSAKAAPRAQRATTNHRPSGRAARRARSRRSGRRSPCRADRTCNGRATARSPRRPAKHRGKASTVRPRAVVSHPDSPPPVRPAGDQVRRPPRSRPHRRSQCPSRSAPPAGCARRTSALWRVVAGEWPVSRSARCPPDLDRRLSALGHSCSRSTKRTPPPPCRRRRRGPSRRRGWRGGW